MNIKYRDMVARYHRADGFWLFMAGCALVIGLVVPSGATGMLMLVVARVYLEMAEE